MVMHQIEYSYLIPEWASVDIDMEEHLSYTEKEAIALAELRDTYDDIQDIEIQKIRTID